MSTLWQITANRCRQFYESDFSKKAFVQLLIENRLPDFHYRRFQFYDMKILGAQAKMLQRASQSSAIFQHFFNQISLECHAEKKAIKKQLSQQKIQFNNPPSSVARYIQFLQQEKHCDVEIIAKMIPCILLFKYWGEDVLIKPASHDWHQWATFLAEYDITPLVDASSAITHKAERFSEIIEKGLKNELAFITDLSNLLPTVSNDQLLRCQVVPDTPSSSKTPRASN